MSSSAFAKRERERIKREKAQKKTERIETRRSEAAEAGDDEAPVRDQAAVLAELQALHEALEAERISFDDFEAAKAELMTQLRV